MNLKNKNNRRGLLLCLTCGISGTIQIPSKWTKPIVDSVLLPAHAQTSTTECLTRASLSVSIPQPKCVVDGSTKSSFRIVDDDPCKPRAEWSQSNNKSERITISSWYGELRGGTETAYQVRITAAQAGIFDDGFARVIVFPNSCTVSYATSSLSESYSFPIAGSSGQLFQATGSVTASLSGISVGDILLTPI